MRTKTITFDMEESPWSVRITSRSDGTGHVGMFWQDKPVPTHERDLNSHEMRDLAETLDWEA